VAVPFIGHPGKSSYHIFPVLLDPEISRDSVLARMKAKQIQTSIHYPAAHLFTYIKSCLKTKKGLLPVTEEIADRALTLPLFPDMTVEQVGIVVRTLKDALSSYPAK